VLQGLVVSERIECPRCQRPQVVCYCAHLSRIETRTRVLVLQHPREHGKAVGTARMAALCLPNAHVAVGVDFARDKHVQAELSAATRPPILLYPGPEARELEHEAPTDARTLVVIDGTWHHARAILRKNPWLSQLPHYAFRPEKPSEYRIRREPARDYVSTIEALTYALALLEGEPERFAALLTPFRAMVEMQLAYAASSSGGRRRAQRRLGNSAAPRLPEQLTRAGLVCLVGEANAWPYERTSHTAPYPHELVHCLAQRLDAQGNDAGYFEALIAPRRPLSRSPITHSRLDEAELHAGLDLDGFRRAFADFIRPDDVLCGWGHYALDLVSKELGGLDRPRVDIRKVVGDYTKSKPGSLEGKSANLGLSPVQLGRGRGGERLGMLVETTRWLAEKARVP
jgi:DTW domain-containing protein YfiP